MDYINTTKGVFNEGTFEEITHMIQENLFRGLSPSSQPAGNYDPEEDEPVLYSPYSLLKAFEIIVRSALSDRCRFFREGSLVSTKNTVLPL